MNFGVWNTKTQSSRQVLKVSTRNGIDLGIQPMTPSLTGDPKDEFRNGKSLHTGSARQGLGEPGSQAPYPLPPVPFQGITPENPGQSYFFF